MAVRLRILFLLLLVATTANLQAQATGPPFLWEISGARTSYLFGTVHLPDPRLADLPRSVNRALEHSDAVYTEIPLDSASLVTQLSHLMISGPGTLKDIIPKPLYQRTEKALQRVNSALSLVPFLKFKVWAVATMLSVLEKQLANPGILPMDARIYQDSQKQGKAVGSLETIEEQVQIFDSLSQQEQLKMLRDTLDFLDEAAAEGIDLSDQLIEWYLRGNLAEFGELMNAYVKDDAFYEAFFDKVLHQRNRLMADRIHTLLGQHPNRSHFFAVGAGHYWGDTGIQKLLKARGYIVTRVAE